MILLIKLKNILINSLLVLASLIIAILLCEFILRFTEYKNLTAWDGYPQYHFKADEELAYDISKGFVGTHNLIDYPYKVFSNQYHCFDYNKEVPTDYMLAVGDSFTWGYAPLQTKWTTLIEQKTAWHTMKCGVSGYGTQQEYRKAKRVIKQVGHAPKYIMMLYTTNDLNDDLAFPQRTVINGYLLNKVKKVDLVSGKVQHYTDTELQQRYSKFMSNSISGYLRRIRHNSIMYALFKLKLKPLLASNSKVLPIAAVYPEMPDNMIDGHYRVDLMAYLDRYDLDWYNKLVNRHINNIEKFVDYANSIGARFLLVDWCGCLQHARLKHITRLDGVYYYNLGKDYPIHKASRWQFDSHWDIQGNKEAAEYIYQHYKKIGIF